MSTIIDIMTIHGNNSTAPSGTEIFELPFNRMRLLKKDNLGTNRSFSSVKSAREGREGAESSPLDQVSSQAHRYDKLTAAGSKVKGQEGVQGGERARYDQHASARA